MEERKRNIKKQNVSPIKIYVLWVRVVLIPRDRNYNLSLRHAGADKCYNRASGRSDSKDSRLYMSVLIYTFSPNNKDKEDEGRGRCWISDLFSRQRDAQRKETEPSDEKQDPTKKWTRSCRKGSEERAAASPGQKDAGGKSALRLQLCNPNHRLLDQHSTKSEQLVSIFIGPSAC